MNLRICPAMNYKHVLLVILIVGTVIVTEYAWHSNTFSHDLSSNVSRSKASIASTVSDRHCVPNYHVFYLKVPKTGSSTFSNILNRKTIDLNLTQIFLKTVVNHSQRGICSRSRTNYTVSKYDMQTHHCIYDKNVILQYMHQDTTFVATLRHPFDNFRSKYYYNQFLDGQLLDSDEDPIEVVIRESSFNVTTHTYDVKSSRNLVNVMYNYFSFNGAVARTNELYLRESFRQIERDFPVVMITELYDESLVMFKRFVCWDMKDILYVWHKSATFLNKDKSPEEYGKVYQKHQEISSADYSLYKHFLKLHKKKVHQEGSQFLQEVKEFKRLNALANQFCRDIYKSMLPVLDDLQRLKEVAVKSILFPGGLYNKEFELTGGDCLVMALGEKELTDAITASTYDSRCNSRDTDKGFHCPEIFKLNAEFCSSNSNHFVWKNIPHSEVKANLFRDMDLTYVGV